MELSPSQQQTYIMLAQNDIEAARRYKQYCLESLQQPTLINNRETKKCAYCKQEFYRKKGETPAIFKVRKACSKK